MKDIVVAPTQLNHPKSKRWGLKLVLWSFLAFIGYQVVLAVMLSVLFPVLHPEALRMNAAQLTKAVTDFSTQPAILLPTQFAAYALWLGYMIYAAYKKGSHRFRKEFWIKFRWFDPLLGIAIAVGLTAFEGLLFWFLFKVLHFDEAGASNGQFLFTSHGFWLYATTIGLGGIIGPLFEELYFRGFIMQGLIRYFRKGLRNYPVTIFGNNTLVKHPGVYVRYLRFKRWLYAHKYVLSALVTGIIFGAIHYQGGATFGAFLVPVFTGGLGFVLGLIVIGSRRFSINVFTHMAFNTISLVMTLLGISLGF